MTAISFDALLRQFSLQARVFFSGRLCAAAGFGGEAGHLHLVRQPGLRLLDGEGRTHQIEQPSLLYLGAGHSHRLLPGPADGVDLACAAVNLGLHARHPLVQALPPLVIVPLDQLPAAGHVLEALFLEARNGTSGSGGLLDRLCEVALSLALRHGLALDGHRAIWVAGLSEPRLARALDAIHQDPAVPWTVAMLAERSGLSRASFFELFRTTLGQTPGDYLAHWRLGVAQALLLRGLPMKVVCHRAGYSNGSALARAFGAQLGLSPMAWLARQAELMEPVIDTARDAHTVAP